MRVESYSFAGFCVEIVSEEEISHSHQFDGFRKKGEPDVFVTVIKGSLPEKSGEMLHADSKHEWRRDGEKEILYTSFYDGKSDGFITFSCRVREKNKVTLYIDYDSFWEKMVFEALYLPDILLSLGAVVMHGSLIEKNGEAIVFTAEKQVGKSTQASLWEKYGGATVINGDRAAVCVRDGAVYACGIPLRGSSEISLPVDAPLKAIVLLGQAKENTITIPSKKDAFVNILGKFTYETWNENDISAACDLALILSEKSRVLRLDCLPDESAVRCLENEFEKQ